MTSNHADEPVPVFAGLVYDEEGRPLEVTTVGNSAFYVVLDDDFRRHIEADQIDDVIIAQFREQILAMEDTVSENVMRFIGRDDLFTKAAIDSAIDNFDAIFHQPGFEQVRTWLGLMGFRAVVNVHGELVHLDYPAQSEEGPPEEDI